MTFNFEKFVAFQNQAARVRFYAASGTIAFNGEAIKQFDLKSGNYSVFFDKERKIIGLAVADPTELAGNVFKLTVTPGKTVTQSGHANLSLRRAFRHFRISLPTKTIDLEAQWHDDEKKILIHLPK